MVCLRDCSRRVVLFITLPLTGLLGGASFSLEMDSGDVRASSSRGLRCELLLQDEVLFEHDYQKCHFRMLSVARDHRRATETDTV